MSNFLSISVVLPAYNEAGNISLAIISAVNYLRDRQICYEVIVVNDGSVDSTQSIVTDLAKNNPQIRLINHQRNLGYGSALRSGFDQAIYEYIFLTDSDGQFDISDLDQFLPYIDNSQDSQQGQLLSQVVIGYRAKRADLFVRSLNAWLYHIFIQLVLGIKAKDIDCAFKLFPRNIYEAIKPIKSNGALFSAEFLLKLQYLNLEKPVIEKPVRHFPRKFGVATGANIQVILKMFWECWKLKQDLKQESGNRHQIQLKPNTLSGINHIRS